MSKRKHADAQEAGTDGGSRRKKRKTEKKKIEIDNIEQQQPRQTPIEVKKNGGEDHGKPDDDSLVKKKQVIKKVKKSLSGPGSAIAQENSSGDLTTAYPPNGSVGSQMQSSPGWILSEPIGGRLLDIDPVFSFDEQYLLLAYESSIAVYAVSTSLLVRLISTTARGYITDLTLLPHQQSHLQFSTSSGIIEQWDWTEGKRIGRWDVKSYVTRLATSQSISAGATAGITYTVDFKEKWMITAHRLRNDSKTELHTLLKCSDQITQLKVLANGQFIVASAEQRLILGTTKDPCPNDLKSIVYTWREFECSEKISSLDVRISGDVDGAKDNSTARVVRLEQSLSIVTGGFKGAVFVYQDILGKLVRREKDGKLPGPTSQKLHWHRNEAMAVKWSTDGNYIISGGVETVLVLWQLDTGQKQLLPHLSAAIESIVVSPTGSSYGIRLANNSAIILSTAELQPKFSISGIQISGPTQFAKETQLSGYLTTSSRGEGESLTSSGLPVTVSATGPNRLFLAVPASTSRNYFRESTNAAFLQTLDVKSGSQMARQALTRNTITSLNMSPDSRPIEGPNVTLVQISNDGQWLATIDEWMPPREDVAFLAEDDNTIHKAQRTRMEVFLKFWSFNADRKIWELVSRIDNPHANSNDSSKTCCTVLDLAAEPSALGFATIGDDMDCTVKIWKPHIQYRSGLVVLAKDGTSVTSWSSRRIIQIPALNIADGTIANHQTRAKLAFSADGSLLILGYQKHSESLIHMIDVENSNISYSLPSMVYGPLKGVGIIGRYLMILSNELIVWDLVDDQIHYAYSLIHGSESGKQESFMAVDQKNITFAIAIPKTSKKNGPKRNSGKDLRMQLAVFDPAHPKPLFTETLPRGLLALASVSQRRGYLAISQAGELRTLFPSSYFDLHRGASPNADKSTTPSFDSLFGNPAKVTEPSTNTIDSSLPIRKATDSMVESSEDVPIVRQHHITEIFDTGPSFALPSMSSLFEQIARVFQITKV